VKGVGPIADAGTARVSLSPQLHRHASRSRPVREVGRSDLKDVEPRDLASAIRSVHAGHRSCSPTSRPREAPDPAAASPLTASERDVS